MLKNIATNKALGFTENQWGQLIEANGLLLMWFIEWNQVNDAVNKDKEKPLSIMDFFKQKYNMSAGGDPWDMKGKVSLDGKYVSENSYDDDEDLAKRLKKGSSSRSTPRKFGINKIHEITGYSHKNITGLFNWIGLFKDASLQVSKDTIEKIEEYGANRYYVHLNVPEKNVDGVGLKTIKKKIWIDGESLMNLKLFCDIAMSQAKVWIPRMTPKEFEEIMMAKFYNREQSKEYVKEAEEDSQFKMFFLDYLDTKGVYTDKEQLAVYKLPYYNQEKRTIEFDLNNFEKELIKNRINLKRPDLVQKVQTILKGTRDRGKYKSKSCVAWVIKGEEIEDNKLIWEGESVYIGDSAGDE